MTLFELVKQNICVPDAAEHYGLQVNRNGMCRSQPKRDVSLPVP